MCWLSYELCLKFWPSLIVLLMFLPAYLESPQTWGWAGEEVCPHYSETPHPPWSRCQDIVSAVLSVTLSGLSVVDVFRLLVLTSQISMCSLTRLLIKLLNKGKFLGPWGREGGREGGNNVNNMNNKRTHETTELLILLLMPGNNLATASHRPQWENLDWNELSQGTFVNIYLELSHHVPMFSSTASSWQH